MSIHDTGVSTGLREDRAGGLPSSGLRHCASALGSPSIALQSVVQPQPRLHFWAAPYYRVDYHDDHRILAVCRSKKPQEAVVGYGQRQGAQLQLDEFMSRSKYWRYYRLAFCHKTSYHSLIVFPAA